MKCPKESTLEDVKRKDGENNEKAMDKMSGRSFSDRDHRDRSRTVLKAHGEEMAGKSGGGISGLTEENPEKQAESKGGSKVQNKTLEPNENELKGRQPKTKKKAAKTSGDTAENGQTILDVSEGDVRITKTGASVGGTAKDDGTLNPKGYWITGTTTKYNVIVEKGVRTEITLSDVSITCDKTKMDCINVSHAYGR